MTMHNDNTSRTPEGWTSTVLVGTPLLMALFLFGGDIGKWIAGIALMVLLVGCPGFLARCAFLMYMVVIVFAAIVVTQLIAGLAG